MQVVQDAVIIFALPKQLIALVNRCLRFRVYGGVRRCCVLHGSRFCACDLHLKRSHTLAHAQGERLRFHLATGMALVVAYFHTGSVAAFGFSGTTVPLQVSQCFVVAICYHLRLTQNRSMRSMSHYTIGRV